MKASELRIGNLVYGINRRSEIHLPIELPLKIWQIEIFNCEVLPFDKNSSKEEKWFKISNSDLSPISLTEEWLIKFGFDKTKLNGCYKIGLGAYDYELRDFTVLNNQWVVSVIQPELWTAAFCWNIRYVHQLQNLYFALTGEELTIKAESAK